jgi:hypothetical protein
VIKNLNLLLKGLTLPHQFKSKAAAKTEQAYETLKVTDSQPYQSRLATAN